MRNIKLVIEYDGSRYGGWQRAAGAKERESVQEKLEEVLGKMESVPAEVIGAIRTEAGVHAYAQVANFHTASKKRLYEIRQYLNRYLPRDIAVLEATEADDRFHAAFSAKAYTFEYRITAGEVPSVFDRKYNYYCFGKPDPERMKHAAALLVGTRDLRAFSDNPRMKKSTVRTLSRVEVYGDEQEMTVRITGDDFWPNMARNIVAAILSAGCGELPVSELPELIAAGERERLPRAVDPKGLFLSGVEY